MSKGSKNINFFSVCPDSPSFFKCLLAALLYYPVQNIENQHYFINLICFALHTRITTETGRLFFRRRM